MMKNIVKCSALVPESFLSKALAGLVLFCVSMQAVYAGPPASNPIFLQQPVRPLMMLNMSRDHQLYFKLYDDYSDLDGGGADTTYKSSISYFGYFDSNRCYSHDGAKFSPTTTASKTCNAGSIVNEWSGNFLNWATMTRMDAVRKILYGGFRSTDSTTQTILERAYLPPDTHAFAKFYNGSTSDINTLVPRNVYSTSDTGGISICNVSDTTVAGSNSSGYSQADTSPPLMKIVKGNYALWANNERWQCKWSGQKSASNSNSSSISGLSANSSNPGKPSSNGEFIVRVESCVTGKVGDDEDCKLYPNGKSKPSGVLQKWGEPDRIYFGLITGSYSKSKSGGVLRKNISSIKNEIHANTGQIITSSTATVGEPMPTNTIITTINKLRLFGYDLGNGLYSLGSSTGDWYGPPNENTSSDNCNWFGGASGHLNVPVRRAKFDNGRCSNWGNPQAEIYLESLRYLAGQGSATGTFLADDSSKITGLATASWVDPISEAASGNYCAPLNVLQFNASVNSYDADELASASDIGLANAAAIATKTNAIADAEEITGKEFFVGEDGVVNSTNTDTFQICSAKTVNNFAAVRGICSEAPRLEGSYLLSGLAYHARSTGVKSTRKKVKTYGVSLAPAVPSVTVATGVGSNTLTIMPACRNKSSYSYAAGKTVSPDLESNCAIVDFKVVSQTDSASAATGKLYVSWEDSEQGGDFDQDMWGIIEYSINKVTKKVTVSTQVAAESTGDKMGFGYIIDGTTSDGFKVHSGVNDYVQAGTYCSAVDKCTCNTGNSSGACDSTANNGIADKISATYDLGGSSAAKLKDPLYYAAKWGGYSKSGLTAAEIKATTPSTYFYATDPRKLKESLDSAIGDAAAASGSAATVAANSTQYKDNTYVYQARFNSADWSGQVLARKLEADGTVAADTAALWNTDTTLLRTSTRNVYTYDGTTTKSVVKLTSSNWTSALPTLKSSLRVSSESDDVNALKRFNWILGAQTDEVGQTNGILRERTKMLGDVINSDPAYAGAANMRYDNLPKSTTAEITGYGASSYAQYVTDKSTRTAALFVGSNDGMLHAFKVSDGAELFAYIPRGVYPKLASVSSPAYTHEYLVDGPIYVGDVYITVGTVKKWRTIVAGTLGAGGKGAFALDVTDTLATGAAPKVIFDVTNDKDNSVGCKLGGLTHCDDLGYSPGRVLIIPLEDKKWHAVFGNGSNSAAKTAKLISIDIESPATVDVIDTKAACGTSYPCSTDTDNGLAEPALLPNSSGVVTTAYVGDIMGNLWKFNLSNSTVAFGTTASPQPLITLIDADGVAQPITSPPTLGYNSLRKFGTTGNEKDSVMVYVGTGKYYETTDISSTYPQSVYGISDTENAIALTKLNRETKLHKKVIDTTSTSTDRTITGDKTPTDTQVPAVDWDTKDGWFLDLVQGTDKKGERVISKPLLLFDRLIFPTFIPSSNQCDFGGSSWLMELTGVGDKFIGHDILGSKANHVLNTAVVSGLASITSGDKIVFIATGIGGDKSEDGSTVDKSIVTVEGANPDTSRGRMSWRQIK